MRMFKKFAPVPWEDVEKEILEDIDEELPVESAEKMSQEFEPATASHDLQKERVEYSARIRSTTASGTSDVLTGAASDSL